MSDNSDFHSRLREAMRKDDIARMERQRVDGAPYSAQEWHDLYMLTRRSNNQPTSLTINKRFIEYNFECKRDDNGIITELELHSGITFALGIQRILDTEERKLVIAIEDEPARQYKVVRARIAGIGNYNWDTFELKLVENG